MLDTLQYTHQKSRRIKVLPSWLWGDQGRRDQEKGSQEAPAPNLQPHCSSYLIEEHYKHPQDPHEHPCQEALTDQGTWSKSRALVARNTFWQKSWELNVLPVPVGIYTNECHPELFEGGRAKILDVWISPTPPIEVLFLGDVGDACSLCTS